MSRSKNDDVRGVNAPGVRPAPGALASDLRTRAPQDVRRAVVAKARKALGARLRA